MPGPEEKIMVGRIRACILVFMAGLVLSGLSAFPLESELAWLSRHAGSFPESMRPWITRVHAAVTATGREYPFLAYGTDWLAFGHFVIALAFAGPLVDPVRNRWVVTFGIWACLAVIPMALLAGAVRHIPWWWRLVDCSFGVAGLVPLLLARKFIRRLERLRTGTA